MKKFNFKLENILSIRRKLESQAKMNFGIARARLNDEEKKLEVIENRIEDYLELLKKASSGDVNLKEVARCNDGIIVLENRKKIQQSEVKRAENQLELMRSRLNQAMLDRKTIEHLREEKVADYLTEINIDERKQIDELVSYRKSNKEQNSNVE